MRKAKGLKRGGRGGFAEGAEGTEKCELRGAPDALGGGAGQRYIASCGSEGESLVVVAFEEPQLGSGTDAAGFEEFEEVAVAFIDSADGVGGAGSGVGEQKEATMAAAGGAFHLAEVAVGTGAGLAQLGQEFGFEIGGDVVLEALGFVVNFPPFHAEEFGQHAFDEVVAEREFAGDLASGGGEAQVSVGLNADQAIFFKTTHRHGDRRSGNLEPVGEAGGDNGFTFALGLEDGFEIVFFRAGDHLGRLYGGLSMVNGTKEKPLP